MSSKQVTDREKSADAVIAAAETHADAIHQSLSALCKDHLRPGEVMPDFALATHLFGRVLGGTKVEMVESDRKNEVELGDDEPARNARDQIRDLLYTTAVEQREVFTGVYGAEFTSTIISGITPRDPVVLSRFAQEIIDKLDKAQLPAPRIKGAMIDKQAIIATLTAQKKALDESVQAVAREVREAQVTQVEKDRSITKHDKTFSKVATQSAP